MTRAHLSPPHDLTIPASGSQTARQVLSRAMARSLRDLGRLVAGGGDPSLLAFKPHLQTLLRQAPGALASVLRSPTIGALLRCLRRRAPEVDFHRGARELIATLAFDLAHSGALREAIELDQLPARIVCLPARRVFEIPSDCRRARFTGEGIELSTASGRRVLGFDAPAGAEAFVPIAGGIHLALVDNNPLAMSEAHPDKQGNALDLGGRPAEQWCETLAAGLELIGRHMPELRGEIDLYLHQIVPVGYDDHRHLSASYQEAIGTVYLSLHPQAMTMVEATIHEFQHNKLHALLELDPLLDNAFSPLYASPVRPDPRPPLSADARRRSPR